jgi:hypothetical protein
MERGPDVHLPRLPFPPDHFPFQSRLLPLVPSVLPPPFDCILAADMTRWERSRALELQFRVPTTENEPIRSFPTVFTPIPAPSSANSTSLFIPES